MRRHVYDATLQSKLICECVGFLVVVMLENKADLKRCLSSPIVFLIGSENICTHLLTMKES